MGAWHDVGADADVTEGETVGRQAGGAPVALFRLEGAVYALHDLCPHGQARLSDGFVDGACVECPLHQGLIDIATGEPRSAPITEAVRAFPVRVIDGRIEVMV